MHLYELSEQYQTAFNELSGLVEDGSLPIEAMTDTLEALGGELREKAKNVGAWIKNLEADITALKDAEKALANRRKSIETRVNWAYEYLKKNMDAGGITEIDCSLYSLKIQKNPPSVHIFGEVPKEYMVVKTTESPDKKAIKALIENGGCEFAEIQRGTRLVIK